MVTCYLDPQVRVLLVSSAIHLLLHQFPRMAIPATLVHLVIIVLKAQRFLLLVLLAHLLRDLAVQIFPNVCPVLQACIVQILVFHLPPVAVLMVSTAWVVQASPLL